MNNKLIMLSVILIITTTMVFLLNLGQKEPYTTFGSETAAILDYQSSEKIKVTRLDNKEAIWQKKKHQEPVFKGNQSLDKSEFQLSVHDVVDFEYLEKENAKLKLAKYMSYKEYTQLFDSGRLGEVSPDRIMLVIQVYYPNGYEHPKVGLIENALATGIYDVETGEYLGGSYNSVDSSAKD